MTIIIIRLFRGTIIIIDQHPLTTIQERPEPCVIEGTRVHFHAYLSIRVDTKGGTEGIKDLME